MPTRNVVLTERQAELIETLVNSGRYQNASEVLRDGLRLVEQREAEDAGKLKALRAAARIGVGALDRGGAAAMRAEGGNQDRNQHHQRPDQAKPFVAMPVQYPERVRRVFAQENPKDQQRHRGATEISDVYIWRESAAR